MKTTRFSLVDQLRALAITLMIIFHLFYDLNLFGLVKIDFQNDTFWFLLPRIIVFLFLFCVGISLAISHSQRIQWRKFTFRLLKISFFAILISFFTYLCFRANWVYFGTLHCIAVCSLLALPLAKHPKTACLLGILLLIFGQNLPWIKLPHTSMDYIPIFPWLGVVLLGIVAFHLRLHKVGRKENRIISFLGRHSLVIYLLHQPILYGLVLLLNYVRHLK